MDNPICTVKLLDLIRVEITENRLAEIAILMTNRTKRLELFNI